MARPRKKRSTNQLLDKRAAEQKAKYKLTSDFTFDMWGLPQPKPIDTTVHVWTDLSVIKDSSSIKKTTYVNELLEAEDMALNPTKKADLGFQKSLDREKRLTKLTNLIDVDGVKTIQEALKHFPDLKTARTVQKYLRIIGRKLLDETNGRYYGSDEPHWEELYVKQSDVKSLRINYRYYDKDPNEGGHELTQENYVKHRQNLIRQAGLTETIKSSQSKLNRFKSTADRLNELKERNNNQ